MIPPLLFEADTVRFFVVEHALPSLVTLPWLHPLESWEEHKANVIAVRSGLSRHVVRFIESEGRRFAIKETSLEAAEQELASYVQLRRLGVPTLIPIGVIDRFDGVEVVGTKIGGQRFEQHTGYLITELMEKAVPDSYLFRRAFRRENRQRIWEAVIRLFVELHSHGVHWGDASLANMLIHFSTESVPQIGRRTKLRALLADAETVEMHRSISESLRLADVEFFLESMQWTEADLRASGVVREPAMTADDQKKFIETYQEHFAVEREMEAFELVTHIDVEKLLGDFIERGYGTSLLQHINEHKWYMSERQGQEIPLAEAARDWYEKIFRPVCGIFTAYSLPDYFPEETAASLYVKIMEHKYYISQQERRDAGLVRAVKDFVKHRALRTPPRFTISAMVKDLHALLSRLPGRGPERNHS